MAKTMCPECGRKGHINTAAPQQLEARCPELLVVGFVCRRCEGCEATEEPDDLEVGTYTLMSYGTGFGQVIGRGPGGARGMLYRIRPTKDLDHTTIRRHLMRA